MNYTDLKPGICIIIDKQPYVVLEYDFVRMQQRKPVVKTKVKNLISGSVAERSFQPSDDIEEAEIDKMKSKFLYQNKGEYWFCEANNPSKRFNLKEEVLGAGKDFLKADMEITALAFNNKIFGIEMPIKADYTVTEAPPAIKGDTAQGGTKIVVIETGAKVSAPLFINEGDIIRVNTTTGQYVERAEKGN